MVEIISINSNSKPEGHKSIRDHEGRKYLRKIKSVINDDKVEIDVYSVIVAFGITCPARQHALKKILCCGNRGKGSEISDLVGIIAAISRAIELQEDREKEQQNG